MIHDSFTDSYVMLTYWSINGLWQPGTNMVSNGLFIMADNSFNKPDGNNACFVSFG